MTEIERIFKNSEKAELLERLAEELEDDVVAIVITAKMNDGDFRYTTRVMMLGVEYNYEACGLMDVVKYDMLTEAYGGDD